MALGPVPSITLKNTGHTVLFRLGFCSIQKLSLFFSRQVRNVHKPHKLPLFSRGLKNLVNTPLCKICMSPPPPPLVNGPFDLPSFFLLGTQNTPFTYAKSWKMPAFNPPPPYTQTQTHIPGPMHAMRASKHEGNCWDLSLHCCNHSVTHVQVVFHQQTSRVCTIEL